MNYVMHFCRNKKCNNGWIDKDLTNAKTNPPDWKYCEDCAEKLGIDYDTQTPISNLTEEELKERERKIALAKVANSRRWNIKSNTTNLG